MSFNPFSFENSLEHLVNPKIVSGATGYEVQVDLANVDTYYGRQLGGPTASQEFQQAYIRQLGTTGLPTTQAFITQLGTTGSSGQAFFNQIGSSNSRGNAYFDTIYWNNFSPALPSGGSGGASGITLLDGKGISVTTGVSGTTISSLIQVGAGLTLNNPGNGQPYIIGNTINPTFVQGSTGIRVVTSGNTYIVSSTVAVTGSQYIGVQQSGATFTISYLGSQGGSGTTPITGVSGSYAVFGASGIESSTVLKSSNVVGPTGQLVFYTPQGITSSSLFKTDVPGRQINLPITVINDSTGFPQGGSVLRLTNNATDTFIQSGSSLVQGSGAPLNISAIASGTTITKFDIPTGLVTINPGGSYPSGVQNLGASSVSQNVFYGASGATYNIYMWGGGGAGLSGYAGGAGGFVKVQNISAGSSGITFTFSNGGTGPGGNSLGLGINTGSGVIAAAVAPGGGAGGSAGVGAAYGEPGGSYPGQGFSAGVTGGTGGIYTVYDTNGTTGFVYRLGSGITAQSGIFNNVQVTYGLTGTFPTGTILYGYNSNPSSIVNGQSGTTSTYYFPPGTTLVFQTTGITFNNSLYSLSGLTFGIFNLSLPPGSLTGATFSRQAIGGTYTIDTAIVNQQFQDGFIGGTFSGDGSGIHQILGGHTFSTGLTGLTFITSTNVSDVPISQGIQITFNSDLTGSFSRSLGSVVAPQLRITDPIGITQNSIIQVQYRNTITHGADGILGATGVFGPTGSGYGYYTGGGGTGGGGGGAGSAIFLGGFTGITGAGSGTSPFFDTYNLAGQYGFGGSGGQGGSPYYVIELVSPGRQPDVLVVNGNETINGTLVVNQPANGLGNWAALQFSNGNQSALSTSYSFIKGSDVTGGGINANTLHLYRYGGSTYSFVNQQFAGSPVLAISEISSTGSGVTGAAPNTLDLNANTIIRGNVSLPGGYYADSTQMYGASGTAPSTLTVNGTISGTTGIFSGLLTANGGITASSLTINGGLSGNTGTFSGMLTANGGITASSLTLSGPLILTGATTPQVLYNIPPWNVIKIRELIYFNYFATQNSDFGVDFPTLPSPYNTFTVLYASNIVIDNIYGGTMQGYFTHLIKGSQPATNDIYVKVFNGGGAVLDFSFTVVCYY